jgi:transcriptional regulator with XRE-family HTH domain
MPSGSRRKPERLAEKLLAIRTSLDLSQNGVIRHLGEDERLTQAEVSAYERGVRIPSLLLLLKYADAAGVWMDVLVNDDLDLPGQLPSPTKHEGIRRQVSSRSRKR